MPKLKRTLLYKGRMHRIVFARLRDGTEPAREAIEAMRKGEWPNDPEAAEEGLPSDTQIQKSHVVMARIRGFANSGELRCPAEVNELRDGIWEIKEGEKRLSFYDVDDGGVCQPKRKCRYRNESDYPESLNWQVPGFSEEIRMGHCFGKPFAVQKTPEEDIKLTIQVREEDLSHD